MKSFAHSLISGKTISPKDPTGGWDIVSPNQTDQILARAEFDYQQIDLSISEAKEKQACWAARSLADRKKILCSAFEFVVSQRRAISDVLQKETGRPEHDINLEWKQIEKWFLAFQSEPFLEKDPRGLVVLIESYIWPLYYTLQFSFASLMAGNATIIKPSEKTTLSTLKIAGVLASSMPEITEVLHVLVGEKEFSRRLACHEQVNAVIFMGSYEGGIRIKQDTLHQTHKEILLFLGAKNASIVCSDASESALPTLIEDSFLSAGQHCKSISQIFIHDSKWDSWVELFHDRAKQFKIGGPETGAWMGPLLDGSMVDRYLKFAGISEREGATIVMRGKTLSTSKKAYLVTPTIVAFENLSADQVRKSVTLQSEILSPHVSLIRFKEDEEVVKLANQSHYGLCASVWSLKKERALKIAHHLEVGEVRINGTTLECSPLRAFQAKKKSGNHAFQGLKIYEQLGLKKSIE